MGHRDRKCSLTSAVVENSHWKAVRTKAEAITISFSDATHSLISSVYLYHACPFSGCCIYSAICSHILPSQMLQERALIPQVFMFQFSRHLYQLSQLLLTLYPDSKFFKKNCIELDCISCSPAQPSEMARNNFIGYVLFLGL